MKDICLTVELRVALCTQVLSLSRESHPVLDPSSFPSPRLKLTVFDKVDVGLPFSQFSASGLSQSSGLVCRIFSE